MSWLRLQRRLAPYVFIAPFFLGYVVFWGYPVLNGFWTSLFSEPRGGESGSGQSIRRIE